VVTAGLAAVAATRRLAAATPRLGVFGIDAHAGENGLFGDEDETVTRPAVAGLRRRACAPMGRRAPMCCSAAMSPRDPA